MLSASGGFLNFIDLRYVYETQNTSLKYAVLTGLSYGFLLTTSRYDETDWGAIYNIGVRLRKGKHAIVFDMNIPLYSVTIRGYIIDYKIHSVSIGASYVFFFGKKN